MKTRLATYFTRWDVEEGLITTGLILLMSGLWVTYGLGPALAVSGGCLITLGGAIAFWR